MKKLNFQVAFVCVVPLSLWQSQSKKESRIKHCYRWQWVDRRTKNAHKLILNEFWNPISQPVSQNSVHIFNEWMDEWMKKNRSFSSNLALTPTPINIIDDFQIHAYSKCISNWNRKWYPSAIVANQSLLWHFHHILTTFLCNLSSKITQMYNIAKCQQLFMLYKCNVHCTESLTHKLNVRKIIGGEESDCHSICLVINIRKMC